MKLGALAALDRMNPLVAGLLHAPGIHWLASPGLMTITFEGRRTRRRVRDTLPAVVTGERARAVHRCLLHQRVGAFTAAHLEATVAHRALDDQAGRLDGKRLKEVHVTKGRGACRTCHLEVARAREDDAALNDVVFDEHVKCASGG